MNQFKKNGSIGVVGLGLMGSSIIAALLVKGETVVAVAPIEKDFINGPKKIAHYVNEACKNGFSDYDVELCMSRMLVTQKYEQLASCEIIMECVTENVEIKKEVFKNIEKVVSAAAIITTNTSAIPITILKDFLQYPNRFMGMHWAEPAFTTRFMEIVCSPETDIVLAEKAYQIASNWGKEPTLVRKDIRGFITNRIMYAMYREAFYLVENGFASIEDVDRACRNDGGFWMPFCGLFRYMDITGLQAYYHVMKDLFPELNNQTTVPKMIQKIVDEDGQGIINGKGFYNYNPEEAAEWEKAYEEFAFEISRLTAKYPSNLNKNKIEV